MIITNAATDANIYTKASDKECKVSKINLQNEFHHFRNTNYAMADMHSMKSAEPTPAPIQKEQEVSINANIEYNLYRHKITYPYFYALLEHKLNLSTKTL